MISAAMLTAVSSGVRAPRSRPIGEDSRSSSLLGQPGVQESLAAVLVGAPGAHRPDVGDLGQPQRDLEQRDVELRVVREDRDHSPAVDRPASASAAR